MTKQTDRNYALYPKTGGGRHFKTTESENYRDLDGWVETPQGFIRVASWRSAPPGHGQEGSSLEAIKDGRSYWRQFNKEYTARGLVTLAKRFAAELFE